MAIIVLQYAQKQMPFEINGFGAILLIFSIGFNTIFVSVDVSFYLDDRLGISSSDLIPTKQRSNESNNLTIKYVEQFSCASNGNCWCCSHCERNNNKINNDDCELETKEL